MSVITLPTRDRLLPSLRQAEARVVELTACVQDFERRCTELRRENTDLQDQLHRLRTRNAELERTLDFGREARA